MKYGFDILNLIAIIRLPYYRLKFATESRGMAVLTFNRFLVW